MECCSIPCWNSWTFESFTPLNGLSEKYEFNEWNEKQLYERSRFHGAKPKSHMEWNRPLWLEPS